jgi:hypothetical protein
MAAPTPLPVEAMLAATPWSRSETPVAAAMSLGERSHDGFEHVGW